MNIGENIRLALEGLRANKMRALLTMLGIIIGISSVITILTVGNGLSGSITDAMGSLGATNIMIMLQQRDSDSNSGELEPSDYISEDMIASYRARFSSEVGGISLTDNVGGGKAQEGRIYANVSVTGINTDYLDVNNVELMQGRNINERDIVGSRSVCMVSNKYVNNMFNGDSLAALGQEAKVRVGKEIHVFTIVGVYEYEQSIMNMSFASDKDINTNLYIPISTAQKITGNTDGYTNITVKATGEVDSTQFAKETEGYFNRYYENNERFNCFALSMESITEQMNTMMDTVSIALSVIAGISLLVGGIGVMNIMLVSVTERTREIGTRKALGATNNNIRVQFVVESMIICLIGGIIGVTLGGALGYFGSSLITSPSWPTVSSILLAAGFSMAIGIFFGYYPANKAAKLDPIEALRYE